MAIQPKLASVHGPGTEINTQPGETVQRIIIPKLGPNRFQPADYQFHRYGALLPAGTTLKDVFHPDFFQNYLHELRPRMQIQILTEDNSLCALLMVMGVGRATCSLKVMHIYWGADEAETAPQQINPDDVIVSHGGPSHKWRVVYGNEILAKGYDDKADAEAYRARFIAGTEK